MKKFLMIVTTVGLALMLFGCSSLGTTFLANGVDTYCELPEIDRGLVRAVVAADTAPNKITIECN